MFSYWRRAIRRAFAETLRIFGWPQVLLVPLLFIVGGVIHLFRAGPFALLEAINDALSFGLYANLVGFVVLFFIFLLIVVPSQLDDEAAERIAALQKKLFDRGARQAAIDKLWKLRATGVQLRNKLVSPLDYDKWYGEWKSWRAEVLEQAMKVSPNLHAWLDTLDRVRPGPLLSAPPANDGDHVRDRNNMSEVLLRMQEFLQAEMMHKDIETVSHDVEV